MIVEDNRYTGVILRDEEAFTAPVSGYVNYYIHNGERVAKDSNVYLLDETGKITDALDKVQSSEENSPDSTDYTDVYKRQQCLQYWPAFLLRKFGKFIGEIC